MKEQKNANTGISNRETAGAEERERREHPSIAPESEDSEARADDERLDEVPNRQTSSKSGTRSIAQKESESKYTTQPAPPSRKASGAYGKEREEDTSSEE